MNRAAIDIGSNSLLLLVCGPSGDVLHDEATVVGMSKGLGDGGVMAPARAEHAAQVLAAYVARARALGVPPDAIRAAATSGARRATDAAAFFERCHRETGLRVSTISGEEEARLSYAGATQGRTGPQLVIDLGGGSTEVARGVGETLQAAVSLELGAVRATERFGLTTPARDPHGLTHHIQARARQLSPAGKCDVTLVAGTATTLAGLQLGLSRYDGAAIEGAWLTRTELQATRRRFARANQEHRRILAGFAPDRADYLEAGGAILDGVLERLGVERARVSTRGLRHGLLASQPA